METITLPELAEGVESGTVVSILVKEGDTVEEGQSLIELETDKATVPVPAPRAGKVGKISAEEGKELKVGDAILEMDGEGAGAPEAPRAEAPAEEKAPPKEEAPAEKAPAEEPKEQAPPETRRTTAQAAPPEAKEEAEEEAAPEPPAEQPAPRKEARKAETDGPPQPPYEPEERPTEAGDAGAVPPPASPAVRRLAREFGVNIRKVKGSAEGGRITTDDIKEFAKRQMAAPEAGGPVTGAAPQGELPDFSRYGPVHREPLASIRRKIAANMGQSWSSIPHVHQFHDADVTSLMELQKRYAPRFKEKGVSLTMTSLILKAVTQALKKFPKFNASLDLENGEIVHKDYYHIGVAVDTPKGLIVPAIRDVDKKDLYQLSVELADVATRTRERQVGIDELRGASFTVSNLGGIGGGYFTPIINPPEVAVLGIGRSVKTPVYRGEALVGRMMLPLVLAYDHRLIDGADGARFAVELVRILENFEEALFMGL